MAGLRWTQLGVELIPVAPPMTYPPDLLASTVSDIDLSLFNAKMGLLRDRFLTRYVFCQVLRDF